MKIENEIMIVGIIQPEVGSGKVHLQDYIYSSLGIAPTLTARDWRDPRRILVWEKSNEKYVDKKRNSFSQK